MEKYRILEVDGRFIPQFKNWLNRWHSYSGITGYKWSTIENQYDYCSKPTIEHAREFIDNYVRKNTKKITKIHEY